MTDGQGNLPIYLIVDGRTFKGVEMCVDKDDAESALRDWNSKGGDDYFMIELSPKKRKRRRLLV